MDRIQPLKLARVIKRDGGVVPFDAEKIGVAIKLAFLKDADGGIRRGTSNERVQGQSSEILELTLGALAKQVERSGNSTLHIEFIQDQVELMLMRRGEHEVARDYVRYRQQRAQARAATERPQPRALKVLELDGSENVLDREALIARVNGVCGRHHVPSEPIIKQIDRDVYDGMKRAELERSLVLSARTLIEQDPAYSRVAAALLLQTMEAEVLGGLSLQDYFSRMITRGIEIGIYTPHLGAFDLRTLAMALRPERDSLFGYLGLQTLYDRYFVVDRVASPEQRIELPQLFFMRVAMGLALNEVDRDAKAVEFYNLLSKHDFMSSTPTLFNSGTVRPQLSSCFLTSVPDDLDGIFESIKENALLSKFAGGLGNSWTNVRSMGSIIKGTNGESQGVVPFLKVANDTAVAVNQGGKRKGAVCAYLETWHMDIMEFLELRKNTGDDRRRTHDMNTAHWIPDLFMKRVFEGGPWTLFSPVDVPDLHDLFGVAFEAAYTAYEEKARTGEIRNSKTLPAVDLWRKMLTMLFETGHPWITFKDPINVRSPQQHVGVVHSSNLCTEITLNTNDTEVAVCNLGSVNLVNHLKRSADGVITLDRVKLAQTVQTAMRLLDNVIDINYYTVPKARNANLRHRPVGLGLMGFQDALHRMGIPYASEAAVKFAGESAEALAYEAYLASTHLAEERGRYSTFKGSLWSKNILPQDSALMMKTMRGPAYDTQPEIVETCDWDHLRRRISMHGMRNSNCTAIAPTATISNIVDVSASIEPTYENLFAKSNLSGEFTVINEQLVAKLKSLDLWDEVMVSDLKHFDGSLAKIRRIPSELKSLFATAFEIDPKWIIRSGAARQTWLDQAQSLNVYMSGASGKRLDEAYKLAWTSGLKTTYYLRTLSATSAEKSTGQGGELNAVIANHGETNDQPASEVKSCLIDNPDCEACQ